jgi:hypothetical protein
VADLADQAIQVIKHENARSKQLNAETAIHQTMGREAYYLRAIAARMTALNVNELGDAKKYLADAIEPLQRTTRTSCGIA